VISSWDCCPGNNQFHSTPVDVSAGTNVHGWVQGMNCDINTGVCNNWLITTEKQTGPPRGSAPLSRAIPREMGLRLLVGRLRCTGSAPAANSHTVRSRPIQEYLPSLLAAPPSAVRGPTRRRIRFGAPRARDAVTLASNNAIHASFKVNIALDAPAVSLVFIGRNSPGPVLWRPAFAPHVCLESLGDVFWS
jgi:hypothetical protein